jgi:hypothetical protein
LLLDWWNWVSGTTKCIEQSTINQKHESKPAKDSTMMNMNSTRQLTNENCGSKGYRIPGSV